MIFVKMRGTRNKKRRPPEARHRSRPRQDENERQMHDNDFFGSL